MRQFCIAMGVVSVLAMTAVSCRTPVRPHDGGIGNRDWKTLKGPAKHSKESVRWYLEHTIGLLAQVDGCVPTKTQVAVLIGYDLRRAGPHPGITERASWARIQRAYWHARDNDWEGVAHALGSEPSDDPVAAWNDFEIMDIELGATVQDLYTRIITNMTANGYSAEQIRCVEDAFAACVPGAKTSIALAWISLWEAYEISKMPPMPGDRTCAEPHTAAIICEVCPD